MTTLGTRMREARLGLGLSMEDLAKAAGTSRASISNWETGKSASPEPEPFRLAARRLGVSISFLQTGEESGFDGEYQSDTPEGILLPVYSARLSAGPGSVNSEFSEKTSELWFTRAWLRRVNAKMGDVRIVTVDGESMWPTLHNGDKVAINIGDKEIRDHRVYALAYGDEAKVKRLSRQIDGSVRVSSDNLDKTRFPDEVLVGEAMNNVRIIGRIVHKFGEGGL